MHTRVGIATIAVFALALTAGCLGPQQIPDDELTADAEYNWETDVDAEITITESSWLGANEFKAVYQIDNRSQVELYQRGLSRDRPLRVQAVQFQYPNGTVVGADQLSITTEAERTIIELPADSGALAFTGTHPSKELQIEAYVEGSYRVILPPNHRTADFLLGDVVPGNYTVTELDSRVAVSWQSVDRSLLVRYYAERDRMIFWGLVAGLSVIGLGGYLYFRREIARLMRWREQQGLDVDDEVDDDDRRRPPPGLR